MPNSHLIVNLLRLHLIYSKNDSKTLKETLEKHHTLDVTHEVKDCRAKILAYLGSVRLSFERYT